MTLPALVWAPTRTTVAPAPQPPGLPLVAGDQGPDVASYQGNPNWDIVAASGCRFAFTKATEATNYVNPYFDRNWTEIKRVGLVRGAYHFAWVENQPEAECDWFLSHVLLEGHDIPVLDLETGSGNLRDWALRWLSRCSAATGRMALLYSGAYFMQDHGLCDPEVEAASAGLWLAAYAASPPAAPPGWSEILFWQYTDKESIPGIDGNVDCNIYRP